MSRWLDRGADIALPMTNIGDRERPGLGNGLIACAADSPVLGFALGQCLFNVSRRTGNNIAWVTGPRTLHCALRYARSPRVLLVDQWVETGGTMEGAIALVEQQGGEVAGMVAIAIEETERANALRARFPAVSAVVQGSRWQAECNAQTLSSFADYKPEMAFPKRRRA